VSSASKLDRYRYVAELGRGGMSHVLLAEDIRLGRRVALKQMNASSDSDALLRLRREALIGASVSHHNLVSIYDIVAAGGGEYVIVMEYVEGRTLRDELSGGRALPAPEALSILEGVAAGLDAIHAHGIVHRDVKPGNILLAANGDVKLADLGIASAPDRTRITAQGVILGTFGYMAPEQLDGKPATTATDVYALAAVAYEALSGRKARSESNPVALAHAIVTRPAPDLRDAWPDAPAEAADLLNRAMAADPAARPPSATELTGRLREALERPTTVPFRPVPTASTTRVSAPTVAAADVPGTDRPVEVRPDRPTPPVPVRTERPSSSRGTPAVRPAGSAEPSWRARGLALLGLLLVAAIVAVVLLSSGGPARRIAAEKRAGHHPAKSGPAGHRASTGRAGQSAGASGPSAASSGSATPPATSAASSGSQTPPASSASNVSSPSASTPTSATESFYSLAAAHRYADAWALADPTFRAQLGGYQSFADGQALDRSITFDAASVMTQSADSATVAIQTTSVRANGTQHCSGTVDLRLVSSAWMLHLIHISCA
jgi:eukaryotic-like serine/threonine-protein kinase